MPYALFDSTVLQQGDIKVEGKPQIPTFAPIFIFLNR